MNITTPQFGNQRFRFADANDFANANSVYRYSSGTQSVTTSASTDVAPVAAPAPVAKSLFDSQAVANSILSFVQQRLSNAAQQGASSDQLTALLTQARDGVTTGFGQAVDQLKDSGALTDVLNSGISSALQKVDSGFNDLATQFGITTAPAQSAATPASDNTAATNNAPDTTAAPSTTVATQANTPVSQANTLSQLAGTYRVKLTSKQSINLVVKTADGDIVQLRLGVKDKLALNTGNQTDAASLSARESGGARLSIAVRGNLDAGELQALSALLDKVGSLADSFFSGDINGALQQATALNFASPELSSLSLDLRSSVSVKAKVGAYTAVQSLGNVPSPVNTSAPTDNAANSAPATTSTATATGPGDLAGALTALIPKAALASNPANLLKQFLAAQIGAADQQNNPLLDFVNRLLTALGADASSNTTASTPDTTTAPTASA